MALIRIALLLALAASPARADRAFVGMDDGFVVFDGARATRPFESPRYAKQIAPAGADVVWIGSTIFVHRWARGKLDEKALLMAGFLRIANGVPWLGNQKHVAWFDGAWNELELPRVAGELLNDLEIDDRGRVWILLGGRLLYTEGRKWTTFVGPPDEDVTYCRAATQGDLYLACTERVYRLANNTWTQVMTYERASIDDVHVAKDGTIYVVGGKELVTSHGLAVDMPRWRLNGFAVDTTGRMWFARDNGLVVLDARGKPVKLPRALATNERVHAIAVEGAGPKL